MEPLTLYELGHLIRLTLNRGLPESYWVQAELSEVREAYNGHCYIELVQKAEQGNAFVAKARGTIWGNIYKILKPYFENSTSQKFTAGIKVLLQVTVDYHEQYGLSLTVHGIDPTYTLGDMVRRRREIIMQLKSEGVLTLNKELSMPLLPQRIAVISAAGAAGYGDFCDQLNRNPYGFTFYLRLFPAIMQGDKAEDSIITALNKIASERGHWDVVVIIRGGGATSDLSCFDSYLLATNCAQFPLPIITGIGHERDETVLDVVAHTHVKTPTAAAEYLVNILIAVASRLDAIVDRCMQGVIAYMHREENRLNQLSMRFSSLYALIHIKQLHCIEQIEDRIDVALRQTLVKENHRIQLIENIIDSASPQRQLQRGYTITRCEGKVVHDIASLPKGAILTTEFATGTIQSKMEKL